MFNFLRGGASSGDSCGDKSGDVASTTTTTAASAAEEVMVNISSNQDNKKWRPFVFDTRNDNDDSNNNSEKYRYPSIYEEADEMLQLSLVIYSITDLRSLARKQMTTIASSQTSTRSSSAAAATDTVDAVDCSDGDTSVPNTITTPSKILELPLSFYSALEMLEANSQTIQRLLGNEEHENTMTSLRTIHERYERYHHGNQHRDAKSGNGNMMKSNVRATSSKSDSNDASVMAQWFNSFTFNESSDSGGTSSDGSQVTTRDSGRQYPRLIAYGDDNCDTDIVYAVGIDPVRKRVTVAFRGSTTLTDFIKDSKIVLNFQPNPIVHLMANTLDDNNFDKGDATRHTNLRNYERIGIHAGFYEYLLMPREEGNSTNVDSGPTTSKFDEVLGHVRTAFQQLAESGQQTQYRLYVTGHSLGGCLATLFAFYVAAAGLTAESDDPLRCNKVTIPLPVTCVSIASPRVGDIAWKVAHTKLEELGLLRHLRVANAQDPVTILPKASGKFMWATLSPVSYLAFKLADKHFSAERETFHHTGVKLRLANGKYELTYLGDVLPMVDEVTNNQNFTKIEPFKPDGIPDIKFHGGAAYTMNVASVKLHLEKLFLNEIYRFQAATVLVQKIEDGEL